ncbi:MAG: GlsB/YeaQ/YmgE family stress response membrane protein [Candidatus Krumholzibacteria bacterium]|nr:GlsB/YeaQ/YmgE family stress response membrane protein [Candidatus Krumholzibacteria bacterium]
MNIILFLILGGVAGWLAGLIMKGRGFGILGNIVVGIIGGFLGGFLFGLIGVTSGSMLGSLLMAVVGAVVLLFIVGLLKKP